MFGTSAKYLALAEKEGLAPGADARPRPRCARSSRPAARWRAHSFDYVYRDDQARRASREHQRRHRHHLLLRAGQSRSAPVWRGELQTRGLGMAVDVFDDDGPTGARASDGRAGVHPPVPQHAGRVLERSRRRASTAPRTSSISRASGATATGPSSREHDGLVIHGRSDATLNPGGVRIGTAEIYRQVEQLPEVVESLVVGQEWEGDVRIVLFVRLRDGATAGRRPARPHPAPDPGAREPASRAAQDRCRWPTSRARSAARSPSWRCAR